MADGSNDRPLSRYEAWKQEDGDELAPEDRFRRTTNIALLLSYDLIDKLRFLERATLQRPAAEIEERQRHVAALLEKLREAYLGFADVDP